MEMSIEKKKTLKAVIIIIILLGIGFFAFRIWHKTGIDRQSKEWQIESDALKQTIENLHQELQLIKDGLVSEEKLVEAFGDDAGLILTGDKINCDVLKRQIKAFYRYLDQKDYIKSYRLKNGTSGLFQDIQKTLTEMPPTIIGETRDLFTLLQNMAHFYRVLGKNRLKLIQEILKNEAEIIEPLMAIFNAWFTHDGECKVDKMDPPSVKILYEYSGFFLNTIGGRSYLFRRDSKVRTLISYYSTRILDRANAESLNPYGIDIRQFIDSLIYDIGNMKGLIYHKQYITELEQLKKKYNR